MFRSRLFALHFILIFATLSFSILFKSYDVHIAAAAIENEIDWEEKSYLPMNGYKPVFQTNTRASERLKEKKAKD